MLFLKNKRIITLIIAVILITTFCIIIISRPKYPEFITKEEAVEKGYVVIDRLNGSIDNKNKLLSLSNSLFGKARVCTFEGDEITGYYEILKTVNTYRTYEYVFSDEKFHKEKYRRFVVNETGNHCELYLTDSNESDAFDINSSIYDSEMNSDKKIFVVLYKDGNIFISR